MARQFRLARIRPSADGKTITATVVDRDWTRETYLACPGDVTVIAQDAEGCPVVRFPERKLALNVLDFDR